MRHHTEFYVAGEWVEPMSTGSCTVVDPATEQPLATVAAGDARDVDRAVHAAWSAFPAFSALPRRDRLLLFDEVIEVASRRLDDLADVICTELGAPWSAARAGQAAAIIGRFTGMRDVLATYPFTEEMGSTMVVREPIGVCGLITPWNMAIHQISCKVAPALAAGCTMVLKPSEVTPLSALLFAEILHDAGVPAGVFNLVNGTGHDAGAALAAHPAVDMVSFTGSTNAGIEVARLAAPSVKRVTQELGGKSANIVLADADLETVVRRDLLQLCKNSGQSCNAPSRLLVPHARMDEAATIAACAANEVVVGHPRDPRTVIGPVVSARQFAHVQALIAQGIDEGARVAAGGLGHPDGLDHGFYVKPTVFSHVTNDMVVARDEIFGPVLVLIGYEDDDDAVRIANDSDYGLSGYVSGSPAHARAVALRLRTGMVHLNGSPPDTAAPFGGYRRSGNGREWGRFGLEEYLETKSIFGYATHE